MSKSETQARGPPAGFKPAGYPRAARGWPATTKKPSARQSFGSKRSGREYLRGELMHDAHLLRSPTNEANRSRSRTSVS